MKLIILLLRPKKKFYVIIKFLHIYKICAKFGVYVGCIYDNWSRAIPFENVEVVGDERQFFCMAGLENAITRYGGRENAIFI